MIYVGYFLLIEQGWCCVPSDLYFSHFSSVIAPITLIVGLAEDILNTEDSVTYTHLTLIPENPSLS